MSQAGAAALAVRQAPAPNAPLVAHVLFHLGIGGLENGVVNLINFMPRNAFRHAIVCVRGKSDFCSRLHRNDVPIITLEQKPGFEPASYWRAWRVFQALRPDVVHTRNLAALEMQLPAALAGVPIRIHSEHGRDGADINGDYLPYNLLRRAFRPLVHRYVALSRDLQSWMIGRIGVDSSRVEQIYNGVDTDRFGLRQGERAPIGPRGFSEGATFVVGAIGRTVPIKDYVTLVRGFAALAALAPGGGAGMRLVIVGDGPEREGCERIARELGIASRCWFAGVQDDVASLLWGFDVFCVTSLNEGINNTVLEAMATGLPVVATAVGGNPELVIDSVTGRLIPVRAPQALAHALLCYMTDPDLRRRHGYAGRQRVEREFSLVRMIDNYRTLYERALEASRLDQTRRF
jgi:sugar transferase (PEP-CTERM/EpsH1 system associated)